MADGENRQTDVVKAVGEVVGALAGAVALLYAVGGGVLALRLFLEDLPSRTIVGQLPRDLLISVGLAQIVLPGVAIAALYAAIRVLVGSMPPPRRLVDQWARPSLRAWGVLVAAASVPALAITAYGAARVHRHQLGWDLAWLLPAAFLLSLLIELVALRLRARVALANRSTWNELRPIASMTLVVWLAALPACLVFAGTFPLLDAKVCTKTGSDVNGLLIGETNDRVYVGESDGETRRVISLPQSEVTKTFIGGDARSERCE